MASNISLGYHNLAEERRHNKAVEGETIRSNNLLDTRTRDIADKDRASRETIASKDRTSRELINSRTLANELQKIANQAEFNRQLQDQKYKYETNLQDARLQNTIDLENLKSYLGGDFSEQLGAWANQIRAQGKTGQANLLEVIRLLDAFTDTSASKAQAGANVIKTGTEAVGNILNVPNNALKALASVLSGVGQIIPG